MAQRVPQIQGTGDEIMDIESRTQDEKEIAICKSKNCRHILSRQFIDYKWVTGMCPNPDCFYHTHPQEDGGRPPIAKARGLH